MTAARDPWDIAAVDPAEVRRVLLRSSAEVQAGWPEEYQYKNTGKGIVIYYHYSVKLGGDHEFFFSADSARHAYLIACRVCASGGIEAVADDRPMPRTIEEYRRLYGEFGACYELEQWYAAFGGSRRRILARLLPDRAECLRDSHPLPEGYEPPKTLEEALRPTWRKAASPGAGTKAARETIAAGQGLLF